MIMVYCKNISLKLTYDLLLSEKFNNKKFDLKLGYINKNFIHLVMFNFLFQEF